ncbi:MAG: bifunctional UDP-sugar hydrolase/5'-nucleotidase [Tissierellia bacterium]|nr:bifunctional UDP-sugar hydrolase/5'-nucleotidase [Tissierellia bacterium]
MKLYFTSDSHGFLFPTDYLDREPKKIGLFQVWQEYEIDGNTLMIDGGDTLQGSPFLFYYKDKNAPEMMGNFFNLGGCQYYTLGNHDFNYGYEFLRRYVTNSKATLLCANVEDVTGQMEIRPHAIHTLEDGTRVGLLGAVTHWVNLWERKEHIENFRIRHPLEPLRKALNEIKDQCDVTVLIYHGGIEEDLDTGEKLVNNDENIGAELARELDLDILLTGHQHMPFANKMAYGTHIVQAPAHGEGAVEILWQKEKIESRIIHPKKSSSILAQTYASFDQEVQDYLDRPVAKLPQDLLPEDRLEMALKGSKLADFINGIQKDYAQSDLSITSFANEITGLKKDVTLRNVMLTYPYPNTLVVLEITGAKLKEALEQNYSYVVYDNGTFSINDRFTTPKEEHYNFDFFYGLEYDIDFTKAIGKRITNLRRGGKPIEAEDRLTLAMNNYRATGAGGFDMYTTCPLVKDIQRDVQEILIEAIARMGEE